MKPKKSPGTVPKGNPQDAPSPHLGRRGGAKGNLASSKKTLPSSKKDSILETFIKKHALLVFTLTELLLIFIVFRKFLLFDDAYLFKDMGSDSVNSFWTWCTHISSYLRTTGIPKWSFNWGMGKNIYPLNIGDPFMFMMYLFPKNAISYGTIFVEVLKIYLAGFFFFLFLRNSGMTAFASILGGMLYSFCGFMIIGGSWYIFSAEGLYAALLLYSCERFVRQGAWYLLPIPYFLFAVHQPFLLFHYTLLTITYITAIIFINEDGPEGKHAASFMGKKILLTLCKAGCLALLGIIISSFVFLSDIDMLIHSPRGFGGESSVFKTLTSTSIFTTASLWEITTYIYRLFSNDLMGTCNIFKGWFNYMEAPSHYTGVLTCLLMPQAFFLMRKRTRYVFIALTSVCVICLIFPFFRHLFWLFSGDYYRTYSLFVAMLFLVLSMKTLSSLDSGKKINIRLLIITLVVLLILLFYPFYNNSPQITDMISGATKTLSDPINNGLRFTVAALLVIYSALIYFFNFPEYRKVALPLSPKWGLGVGIIVFCELACFTSITVNNRDVVSSAELHEKVKYNDYTNDAVTYLNSIDRGFYRIDKDYSSSPSYASMGGYPDNRNESLMQNYKSTSSYDSFGQPNFIHFLNEMSVWSIEGINRKCVDPSHTRPLLCVILNEKYFLTKKNYHTFSYWADSLTTIGDVVVTRNKLFLPFGYSYHNYIPLSEFRKLNSFQKDIMLFQAFVADSSELPALKDFKQLSAKDSIKGNGISTPELNNYTTALRKDSLSNLVYTQNTIKGNINISQAKLLFFTIPFDKGWEVKVDGNIVSPMMVNIGFTGIVLDKGEHSVELNYEPPFMKLGCYISGFSIFGYLFLFLRYGKKRF